MHVDTIYALTWSTLALAGLVGLFAGFVKGVTGFGMPLLMISGLATILPPELALAGLIVPTLITNLWQALRQGWRAAAVSARRHWRYLAVLSVVILLTGQLVTGLPTSVLLTFLGVMVVVFAGLMLAGWRMNIHDGNRRFAEAGFGLVSGVTGGLSGVWGPPTVVYLTALETPKVEQVRVQGVIYGVGAVVLTAAHLRSGILNGDTAGLSAMLAVPAIAGMLAGFVVQDRLDQARFRTATLVVLVLAGLNLLRRALIG